MESTCSCVKSDGKASPDPKKAYEELHFKTQYDLTTMANDAWNWQKKNPDGYDK